MWKALKSLVKLPGFICTVLERKLGAPGAAGGVKFVGSVVFKKLRGLPNWSFAWWRCWWGLSIIAIPFLFKTANVFQTYRMLLYTLYTVHFSWIAEEVSWCFFWQLAMQVGQLLSEWVQLTRLVRDCQLILRVWLQSRINWRTLKNERKIKTSKKHAGHHRVQGAFWFELSDVRMRQRLGLPHFLWSPAVTLLSTSAPKLLFAWRNLGITSCRLVVWIPEKVWGAEPAGRLLKYERSEYSENSGVQLPERDFKIKSSQKSNTIKRVILTASVFITFNVQYWRFQNQWRIETSVGPEDVRCSATCNICLLMLRQTWRRPATCKDK